MACRVQPNREMDSGIDKSGIAGSPSKCKQMQIQMEASKEEAEACVSTRNALRWRPLPAKQCNLQGEHLQSRKETGPNRARTEQRQLQTWHEHWIPNQVLVKNHSIPPPSTEEEKQGATKTPKAPEEQKQYPGQS